MFNSRMIRSAQHFYSSFFCVTSNLISLLAVISMIGFLVFAVDTRGDTDFNGEGFLDDDDSYSDPFYIFGPCYGQANVYFNLEIAGLHFCFASVSITTIEPAKVESTGHLWLIAPTVELGPDFNVTPGGKLSIISADLTAHLVPEFVIQDLINNPDQCFEINFPSACDSDPTTCSHAYVRLNDKVKGPFAAVRVDIRWNDEKNKFDGKLEAADQMLSFKAKYPVGGDGNAKAEGPAYNDVGGSFNIKDNETTIVCESFVADLGAAKPMSVTTDGLL